MPLQKIITLRGKIVTSGKGDLVQPIPGWVDTTGARDAAISIHIAQMLGTAGRNPKLCIETGPSVTGKWVTMSESTGVSPPLDLVVPVTTGYGVPSDKQLQRFLRWRIDVSALTTVGDTWVICFSVCVTLK